MATDLQKIARAEYCTVKVNDNNDGYAVNITKASAKKLLMESNGGFTVVLYGGVHAAITAVDIA